MFWNFRRKRSPYLMICKTKQWLKKNKNKKFSSLCQAWTPITIDVESKISTISHLTICLLLTLTQVRNDRNIIWLIICHTALFQWTRGAKYVSFKILWYMVIFILFVTFYLNCTNNQLKQQTKEGGREGQLAYLPKLVSDSIYWYRVL